MLSRSGSYATLASRGKALLLRFGRYAALIRVFWLPGRHAPTHFYDMCFGAQVNETPEAGPAGIMLIAIVILCKPSRL